jgi:hypothetical protein
VVSSPSASFFTRSQPNPHKYPSEPPGKQRFFDDVGRSVLFQSRLDHLASAFIPPIHRYSQYHTNFSLVFAVRLSGHPNQKSSAWGIQGYSRHGPELTSWKLHLDRGIPWQHQLSQFAVYVHRCKIEINHYSAIGIGKIWHGFTIKQIIRRTVWVRCLALYV